MVLLILPNVGTILHHFSHLFNSLAKRDPGNLQNGVVAANITLSHH